MHSANPKSYSKMTTQTTPQKPNKTVNKSWPLTQDSNLYRRECGTYNMPLPITVHLTWKWTRMWAANLLHCMQLCEVGGDYKVQTRFTKDLFSSFFSGCFDKAMFVFLFLLKRRCIFDYLSSSGTVNEGYLLVSTAKEIRTRHCLVFSVLPLLEECTSCNNNGTENELVSP